MHTTLQVHVWNKKMKIFPTTHCALLYEANERQSAKFCTLHMPFNATRPWTCSPGKILANFWNSKNIWQGDSVGVGNINGETSIIFLPIEMRLAAASRDMWTVKLKLCTNQVHHYLTRVVDPYCITDVKWFVYMCKMVKRAFQQILPVNQMCLLIFQSKMNVSFQEI